MRRYLVVANQTLGGAQLAEAITSRVEAGPCVFHIVVPASRPAEHLTWTEGEAREIAAERLERALSWMRSIGAEVTGEVGDQQPMLAVGDALIAGSYDEIILSTLPAGISRWLRQDLPHRIRRSYGTKVVHVVGEPSQLGESA